MRSKRLLIVLLGLAFTVVARAQTTFTWSSTAPTNDFATGTNWVGNSVPADGDTAALLFSDWTTYPDALATVKLGSNFFAYSLEFDGNYPHYYIDSVASSPRLSLSHGITVSASGAGGVDFAYGGPTIELTASQTWETEGNLSIFTDISGSAYDLTKTGSGILTLGGTNIYAHLNIAAGSVYLAASSNDSDGVEGPAGRGPVTMAAGTTLAAVDSGNRTEIDLHNQVSLTGNASFGQAGSSAQLHLLGGLDATAPSTSATILGGAVTFDGITGANVSNITVVSGGAAVFVGHNSLPSSTITGADGSYVGLAGDFSEGGSYSAAQVIAKLNPATFGGTLGFDDDEGNSYGVIDLSNFTNTNFAGLGTLNSGELGSDTTILAPASGANAGVLQLSAFDGSQLKVDASLLTAHGVNSVMVGRSDGRGDNGFVVLNGENNYTGGTTVKGGVLVVSNPDAVGSGTVTVNGGTLVVNETYLYNSLNLVSGKLAGNGYVPMATIGVNFTLSPGFPLDGGRIGQLTFDHLELAGGGSLEWNLQNPNGTAGTDWDLVFISTPTTLAITADSDHRFTLKLISLNASGAPGTATGFISGHSYSWLLFNTDNIEGFDPTNFTFDTSQFVTDAGAVATLSLTSDGYQMYLNFTPVPEPSTYTLLGLGLCLSGFAAWRRRRNA